MSEMRRPWDSRLGAGDNLASLLQQISATRPTPILAGHRATLSVRFALDICIIGTPEFRAFWRWCKTYQYTGQWRDLERDLSRWLPSITTRVRVVWR